MRISVLLVGLLSLTLCSSEQEAHHPPHWSYEGATGPDHWGDLSPDYAKCKTGSEQSPINITGSVASDLPAIEFHYTESALKIINNGHTVQVNSDGRSSMTVGGKQYKLLQFHFHHPSEEHVNGHTYDMVAHLVHADATGHLAVVAVLLQTGNSNEFIGKVWQNIPKEEEKPLEVPEVTLDVKDLLPGDHGYYTFAGSLTTPPCSEGVTWFVLKQPVSLSASQLAEFAKLYPRDARPIEPRNGREILETK